MSQMVKFPQILGAFRKSKSYNNISGISSIARDPHRSKKWKLRENRYQITRATLDHQWSLTSYCKKCSHY